MAIERADAPADMRAKLTIKQSGTIAVVTHRPAWAWRCEECGWLGTELGTELAAANEASDHLWNDHSIAACNPDELGGLFRHRWESVKGTDSTDRCTRCGRYCGK